MREPRLERLRVLRRQLQRGAVRAAENDRHVELAARHVEQLGGGVEHLVEREHGEVPRHELDDRAQADHRRADADAGEAELGDRRVDDAHLTEFLEQAFGDLVCALVDGDFLAHEEDAVVALHFFAQRLVQRVSIRDDWHVVVEKLRRRGGGDVARRVDEHVLVQRLERRLGALVGEIPGVLHDSLDLVVHLVELLVGQLAVLHACACAAARSGRASCSPRARPWCGTCR